MLSISTLKSAGRASGYYEQAEYYNRDNKDCHFWLGKGTEKLALSGAFDFDKMKLLFQGVLPDGTSLGRYGNTGEREFRPGYDLTFSAPKSLSILAFLEGGDVLVNAHNQAVKTTVAEIEREQAATRVRHHGQLAVKHTGNLVVSSHMHFLSREQEPQLHSHCIFHNITFDGEVPRTLYGDVFYNKKMQYGFRYRHHLAQLLLQNGFELTQTRKDGLFEITGVSQKAIDLLSSRRKQILAQQNKVGLSSQKALDIYCQSTKKPHQTKTKEDFQQIKDDAQAKLLLNGITKENLDGIIAQAKERGPIVPENQLDIAQIAVDKAISALQERKAVFSKTDLIATAAKLDITGGAHLGQFEAIVEEKIKDKTLSVCTNGKLTTPQMTLLERENIDWMCAGKQKLNRIIPQKLAHKLANKCLDNQDSAKQFLKISAITDQLSAIQVKDEKEIYTALRLVSNIYWRSGCSVKCLVPNQRSGEKFWEGTKIRTKQVDAFLAKTPESLPPKKWHHELIIVQAAHLLSSAQLKQLREHADFRKAHVVLLGDAAKNKSYRQGKPLDYFLKNNMKVIKIDQSNTMDFDLSVNQKLWEKSLLKLDTAGKLETAAEALEHSIASKVVKDAGLIAVVQNNVQRKVINHEVREQLKQAGKLAQKEHLLPILEKVHLSETEKQSAEQYQIGDILKINHKVGMGGVQKGEYWEVQGVNAKENTVTLFHDERLVDVVLSQKFAKGIDVYKEEAINLSVGDKIAWTEYEKNEDSTLSRKKGEVAEVLNVDTRYGGARIEVSLLNGKSLTMTTDSLYGRHFEHAYTTTLQGANKTNRNAILGINANLTKEEDYRRIYTLVKEKNISILTDDKRLFLSKVNTLNAQKEDDFAYSLGKESITFDIPENSRWFSNLSKEINKDTSFIDNTAKDNPQLQQAIQATDIAISSEMTNKAVAYKEDLLTKAMLMNLGAFDIEHANQAFDLGVQAGLIVPLSKEGAFTSAQNLFLEKNCLRVMASTQNKHDPILAKEDKKLEAIKSDKRLTLSQKNAIETLLTSTDGVTLVQGAAGTGKTTMMRTIHSEMSQLAQGASSAKNINLVGLCTMATARDNLHQKTGIPSYTIQSFVNKANHYLAGHSDQNVGLFGKDIIYVVDEASLVSVKDMNTILSVLSKAGSRCWLMGDNKQMQSIGASHIFYMMLGMSRNSAILNDIVRQKSPIALEVIKDLYAEQITEAMGKMFSSIVEIPDKNERIEVMANVYVAAAQNASDAIMAMLPTNVDREAFSEVVRDKMKAQRLLQGPSVTLKTLKSEPISEMDLQTTRGFMVGDVIRMSRSNTRLGLKAGDYATCQEIRTDRLILKTEEGKGIEVAPSKLKDVEIFNAKEREFQVGDSVQFTRNFEEKGIRNSETAKIVNIRGSQLTFKMKEGKSLELDLNKTQNRHFIYAYGTTIYSAQGQDKEIPLAFGYGSQGSAVAPEYLKIGDQIAYPATNNRGSFIGHIKAKNKLGDLHIFEVKDRNGTSHTLKTRDPIQRYVFDDKSKAPPSTNLNAILTCATRGDDFMLFVDNVEGFVHAIQQNRDQINVAYKYLLSPNEWKNIVANVANSAKLVHGIAEKSLNNQHKDFMAKDQKAFQKRLGSSSKQSQKSVQGGNINTPGSIETAPKNFVSKYPNARAINERLCGNIVSFVSSLYGNPTGKGSVQCAWSTEGKRNKGNLSVCISGHKMGYWKDFKSDAGGKNMISLYAYNQNISYDEAAKMLEGQQNISLQTRTERERPPRLSREESIKKIKIEHEKKRDLALQLYKKGQGVKGTIGEKYLRKERHYMGPIPTDFKFLKACYHGQLKGNRSALLVPVYDKKGTLQAVNRIYLNDKGEKLNEYVGDKKTPTKISAKLCLGNVSENSVQLNQSSNSSVSYLAEGTETALSIAQAMPQHKVLASLSISNLHKVEFDQTTKTVVLCIDNDGIHPQTRRALIKAIESFQSRGFIVKITCPMIQENGALKCDFNDVHTKHGIAEVRNQLNSSRELSDVKSLSKDNEPIYDSVQKLDQNRIEMCQKNEKVSTKTPDLVNQQNVQINR